MTTSPSFFYLFASDTGEPDQSAATVFYKVEGESLAKSLCNLFTKEYANANGCPCFSQAPASAMSPEEQVLLDETLDTLEVYDDPDPGIYDPPPSKEMHMLAQYGVRARKWEDLFRDKTASDKPAAGSTPANSETAEQALVIARAKTKRLLAELTSRAHTEVAKTLSNANLHGMLHSSGCLLAVGQVAESTAKELMEKVTAIYVDTVGSDLPKDTAIASITTVVDEFYAEFKSKHQSRFTGLMGAGAQILGKLDEKIAALKASIPEGLDIALFDAKKQTGSTGSPSADQGEVSEEEAKEALRYIEEMYKEFAGRYHVFPLVRRQSGRALLRTIEAGEAILRDYPETLTPKQSEVVAWLLDYLVEYADYHDLLDMSQRMSHETEVSEKLNELNTLGMGVFVGSYPAKQVFDNGKSLTLTISVILIAATNDTRIKHQPDGTEFIQGAIPKRKRESEQSKGTSSTGTENTAGTKDDMHRVAVGVEAMGTELRELRQAMAAVQHEKSQNAARPEQETPGPYLPSPLKRRIMKGFDWITNGLSAATAAMSTAPPDQWADGRVVGVATSTFLLGAIQARRAEHENRSRDEVIAAVRKGLEDLERRLSASESEKAAWTDTLKKSLSEQLTAVALSVEGCQGRIADLDKSVGSVLDRVARVEEFVHAHARGEAVLVKLVDCSFTDLSLPAQNLIHDILDDRFTKEHLSVLAERCGVDWDNLAGETKSKKAMELIKECRNSGRFAKLIGEIERKRPGAIGLPNRIADLAIEVPSAKPKPK